MKSYRFPVFIAMKPVFVIAGLGFLVVFGLEITMLISERAWSAVLSRCLIAALVVLSVIGGVYGAGKVRGVGQLDS